MRIVKRLSSRQRMHRSGRRRSLGWADNAVILQRGWALTNSSLPATVSTTGDGQTRLDFINPRTDEIDTVITARPLIGAHVERR